MEFLVENLLNGAWLGGLGALTFFIASEHIKKKHRIKQFHEERNRARYARYMQQLEWEELEAKRQRLRAMFEDPLGRQLVKNILIRKGQGK